MTNDQSESLSLRVPAAIRRRVGPYSQILGIAIALAAIIGPTWVAMTIGGVNARIFWEAGRHVLHGESPYGVVSLEVLGRRDQFVYPAFAGFLFAPFGTMPWTLGGTLLVGLTGLCAPLALRIVGVRSVWCMALALSSMPVFFGLANGSITGLLLPGIAVIWVFRDRPWIVAFAIAFVTALKVFLGGMVVWCLLTRRWRAAALSALVTAVVVVGTWALIGFDSFFEYPRMLELLAEVQQHAAFAPTSFFLAAGTDTSTARAASAALAAILLMVAAWRARESDEIGSFAFVLLALMAFSPVIWIDYLALPIIALAARRPTLDRAWLLVPGMWLLLFVTPRPFESDGPAGILLALGLATALCIASCSAGRRGQRRVAGLNACTPHTASTSAPRMPPSLDS